MGPVKSCDERKRHLAYVRSQSNQAVPALTSEQIVHSNKRLFLETLLQLDSFAMVTIIKVNAQSRKEEEMRKQTH